MKKRSITFLIPSYSGSELLKKHLPAVVKAADTGDQILIIDDASKDRSVPWLKRKYKLELSSENGNYDVYDATQTLGSKKLFIKLIVLSQNSRFAAAVNLGFELANNNLIFLLNNDVSPEKNSRKKLIEIFHTQADVFAVACLEYEGKDKTALRSGKNQLWFERGLFHHSRANNFAFGSTAWASGGSAMFDRKKWLELNGFDLKFQPAYWEDIDISQRAKKRAWKVLFQPEAIVFHQHESTNSKVFTDLEIQKISFRHADRFTRKHADIWQLFAFILWRPYWWVKRHRLSGKSLK